MVLLRIRWSCVRPCFSVALSVWFFAIFLFGPGFCALRLGSFASVYAFRMTEAPGIVGLEPFGLPFGTRFCCLRAASLLLSHSLRGHPVSPSTPTAVVGPAVWHVIVVACPPPRCRLSLRALLWTLSLCLRRSPPPRLPFGNPLLRLVPSCRPVPSSPFGLPPGVFGFSAPHGLSWRFSVLLGGFRLPWWFPVYCFMVLFFVPMGC